MNQWTDIHIHILPSVDDGSVNLEQTRSMLEIAHEEGIIHIIATPHYGVGYINPDIQELQKKLELVREEAKKIDPDFQIDLGNELFYSEDIIEHLKKQKALTMAGTRYVLVEFPVFESFRNIRTGLHRLLINGYLPILAHVERYESLYRNLDRIEELVKLGVYMQMNITSILGGFTNQRSKYCKKLMSNGYIHFVATDSHSDHNREPRMIKGVNYLSKKYGIEFVNLLLVKNTSQLLSNKYI
ncbi:CpsB/CapC family capsule biosynthesis tyrosine phosphatase [Lachnoclostridium phytofermentans]|uniref:protein-tyrosine-phosphatase n=1 Tax=Lachnoclostridium phytofermentans (strain ATCC 700394 / DSM 18823 / ISDg) TaxID=357809 RepID=A9KN91_LACP7|nr:CpsB/CapC family capsule biosynthesis tyrosine phosphatase [Lachnoclostridium phytofermentans]ABX41590.1 Protein-tyrosine-phosphatase [Lachnoclostridium phytofermentans ISDg]